MQSLIEGSLAKAVIAHTHSSALLKAISPRLSVDLKSLRQNDGRTRPDDLNVIAMTVPTQFWVRFGVEGEIRALPT